MYTMCSRLRNGVSIVLPGKQHLTAKWAGAGSGLVDSKIVTDKALGGPDA